MERALPPLPYTILPLTHDPWPLDQKDQHSTTTHIPSYSSSLLLKALLAAFVLVMIIVTVVGNALVFLAVVMVRKLQQPANFLIVSLAIADFCVGMLVMPLALVDLLFPQWPLGRYVFVSSPFFSVECFSECTRASACSFYAIGRSRKKSYESAESLQNSYSSKEMLAASIRAIVLCKSKLHLLDLTC
ncbi:unnamed protein product [Cylicostephanus goldi]|uniref:G-protein coupled receptors family 1 profile domain-containing protein n=1 Tax=Cylicostephanus goldi TaxID=71465 RepID=A0A3P6RAV8_CYLGO|nr:unnamed protein product [Cylicostephanus goldi]